MESSRECVLEFGSLQRNYLDFEMFQELVFEIKETVYEIRLDGAKDTFFIDRRRNIV
jgi:hypothetical protein